MTHLHESSAREGTDLDPVIAPSFGDVPQQPFEHTPERLVLSSEEHTRLSSPPLSAFAGEFAHEQIGRGRVSFHETGEPGAVHVLASIVRRDALEVELEADVRAAWLVRTATREPAEPGNIQVVRELVRLAELPGQSTVRVRTNAG